MAASIGAMMIKPGDTIGYIWNGEPKSGTVIKVTGTTIEVR